MSCVHHRGSEQRFLLCSVGSGDIYEGGGNKTVRYTLDSDWFQLLATFKKLEFFISLFNLFLAILGAKDGKIGDQNMTNYLQFFVRANMQNFHRKIEC